MDDSTLSYHRASRSRRSLPIDLYASKSLEEGSQIEDEEETSEYILSFTTVRFSTFILTKALPLDHPFRI
jgi:hypothetical protein